MSTLTAAVVGIGYLGRFHAQKYAELPDIELRAVVDTNIGRAQPIATELGVEALTDYRGLLGHIDAVSIAVPTCLHFEIARDFLLSGSHVLIEKPITARVDHAQELIDLATSQQRTLQVGHLERFNSAILNLERILTEPVFIESHRLAPFKPRGTDVSVVLDLMIHDIDIILNIVRADLRSIDASGAAVLTDEVDIANARLVFGNGCVANVTASRVSVKSERKMRIFQPDAYISVDFQARTLTSYRKGKDEMYPGIPNIDTERCRYEEGDALKTEIEKFIEAIRQGRKPVVSGEDGKRALIAAIKISQLLLRPDLLHDSHG